MYNGHNQRNADLGGQQSHPIVYWNTFQPSDYMSPSSNQSSSSPLSCPEDNLWIARPEFNTISPDGLLHFIALHDRQSSRHSVGSLYSQEYPSVMGLRQTDPPMSPDYSHASQRTCIQDSPRIQTRREDWQYQSNQSAAWPSPYHYRMIPLETSTASSFAAQPESAVQGNLLSDLSIHQATLFSKIENREILVPQQSTCYVCHELVKDLNALQVHSWSKHPPPAGSPDVWTPRKCLWKDCYLPKTFKTSRDWLTHAIYVHQKRYRCSVFGCRATPFGSQADVERHHLTKHVEPKYCTKTGCQAPRRANLCRKDKLDEHEATWHGRLMCTVDGCPRRRIDGENHGFSEQSKLEKHMRQKHQHFQMLDRGTWTEASITITTLATFYIDHDQLFSPTMPYDPFHSLLLWYDIHESGFLRVDSLRCHLSFIIFLLLQPEKVTNKTENEDEKMRKTKRRTIKKRNERGFKVVGSHRNLCTYAWWCFVDKVIVDNSGHGVPRILVARSFCPLNARPLTHSLWQW